MVPGGSFRLVLYIVEVLVPLPPTHAFFFLPPGAKKEPYHFGELHKYGRVLLFEIPVGEGMGERQRGMVRKDKRKKQWVITNERD